jgi:hypothetical protein
MTIDPITTDTDNSPPDWDTITHDLACPRCGYNLHMLTVARCPECGLGFSWREILRAAEDEQTGTWTFEYQWRRKPLKAFFRTVGLCLLPWRLWRRLPLTATPRVGPLLLLISATAFLFLVVSAAVDFAWIEYIIPTIRGQRTFAGFQWLWRLDKHLRQLGTLLLLFLPLWLAVEVFRQTIARHRIRRAHILRIFVFTWMNVVVWSGLISAVLTIATMPYMWWSQSRLPAIVFTPGDVLPSVMLLISLGFAFSIYLRVRGGWLWAVVVFALAAFFVVILGLLLSLYYYEVFSNPYWDAIAEWFPGIRFLSWATEHAFLWLHGLP